jgi:hypothetical protein
MPPSVARSRLPGIIADVIKPEGIHSSGSPITVEKLRSYKTVSRALIWLWRRCSKAPLGTARCASTLRQRVAQAVPETVPLSTNDDEVLPAIQHEYGGKSSPPR